MTNGCRLAWPGVQQILNIYPGLVTQLVLIQGASTGTPTGANVTAALREGISFYQQLQQPDGHWPGDYGGPMFLMPGLVITCYVTGVLDEVLSEQHKVEMLRYLRNHQNRDGGYGLHIEGQSTMFGTALRY